MADTDCPLYRLNFPDNRLKNDDSTIVKNKLDNKSLVSMTEKERRLISWYPMVNEKYHPLPRQWSNNKNEKCNFLGLSLSGMTVFYKGAGKDHDHKNAASVRTTHPIPQSCGIYYFEVKIISKGRDGYMGIGLTSVEKMENRLPGWDKNSYGYHGDDGNSFCSSGQGQPYGPTFSTGDTIGCCVNFIDNTCFYTKNGHNLGIAFKHMANKLYPTVGLQTPGEIVEANFGEDPFVFDFAEYLEGWRCKMKTNIGNYVSDSYKGDTETDMQKMVLSYLSFQGYTSTLEAFSRDTNIPVQEDISSIKNRQKIQQLVLMGRISEAISLTHKFFPALLQTNHQLHFKLKCRQFIEMIGGVDTDSFPSHHPPHLSSPSMHDASPLSCRSPTQPLTPSASSNLPTLVSNGNNNNNTANGHFIDNDDDDIAMDTSEVNNVTTSNNASNSSNNNSDNILNGSSQQNGSHQVANNNHHNYNNVNNNNNVKTNCESQRHSNKRNRNKNRNKNKNRHSITGCSNNTSNNTLNNTPFKDTPYSTETNNNNFVSNNSNSSSSNNGVSENNLVKNESDFCEENDTLDTINDNKENDMIRMNNIKNIVKFGQNLHLMIEQLKKEGGGNEHNEIALRDAFSLLAYTDPWQSPMSHQLKASEREALSNQLNSAILDNIGQASQSSLHMAVQHQRHLLALMSSVGLATSAFASFSLF